MSVIIESEKGDQLVCIEEFEGPPQDVRPSPQTNRTFNIGERVRYLGFYRHLNLADNPVCWMVIFEAADGKRYAATQTYFVTEDCWQNLSQHFARKQGRSKPRKKMKTTLVRTPAKKKLPVASVSKKRRIA